MPERSLINIINNKLTKTFIIVSVIIIISMIVLINWFIDNYVYKYIYRTTIDSISTSLEEIDESYLFIENIYDKLLNKLAQRLEPKLNSDREQLDKFKMNLFFEEELKALLPEFEVLGINEEVYYFLYNPQGEIIITNKMSCSNSKLTNDQNLWQRLRKIEPAEIVLQRFICDDSLGIPKKCLYLKLADRSILELGIPFNQDIAHNFVFKLINMVGKEKYMEKVGLYYCSTLKPVHKSFSKLTAEDLRYLSEVNSPYDVVKNVLNKKTMIFYTKWTTSNRGNNYSAQSYYLKLQLDFSSLYKIKMIMISWIVLLLLLAILSFYILNRRLQKNISTPFVELAESMNNIGTKDLTMLNEKIERTDIKEVNMLLASYQEMTSELSSSFQELKALNEELTESYQESSNLAEKLNDIILVATKLTDSVFEDKETFLNELFFIAKKLIPEADYGSVYVIEGDQWRFINTIGHDLKKLSSIPLKKEYLTEGNNVQLVENITAINKDKMPEEILKEVIQASKPIKSTLVVKLWVGKKLRGGMSFDIGINNDKKFSNESVVTLKALGNLAAAFLTMQSYRNIQENFQREIIKAIINILEMHDKYTKGHSENVRMIARLIAEKMGFSKDKLKEIEWTGLVHDIGKILVGNDILNKPGRLTESEYAEIKKHPIWGYKVLHGSKELENIALYVRHHHERWDGSGYPDHLKNNEIPLVSRIIALADAWDTMRSNRVYRKKLSKEKALQELIDNKGRQFAPEVVDVALNLIAEGRLN